MKQDFAWKTPHELLIYLLQRNKDVSYSENALYILLRSFTKYYNRVKSNDEQIYLEMESFQETCRDMEQTRTQHDLLLSSDLYTTQYDDQPPPKFPKSQTSMSNTRSKPLLRWKKAQKSLSSDQITLQKGILLISTIRSLKQSINSYFSALKKELFLIYFESESAIPRNHAQGYNQYLTRTGVNNAVSSAEHRITPTVLGMVAVLHEKTSNMFSLDFHIQNAWEFLKAEFSKWRIQQFRWALKPPKLIPKAMFVKKFIDWPNSKEAFDFFLVYGGRKDVHMGYVWYLARQWQDLMICEFGNLKPNSNLNAQNSSSKIPYPANRINWG